MKVVRALLKFIVVFTLALIYQAVGLIALGTTRTLRTAVDGAWWLLCWANRTL